MAKYDGKDHLNDIEFDRVYTFRVGSIPVVFGRCVREGTNGPQVFGAALSERELRREKCGYGATEAEAAADLFRYMRPDSKPFGLDF